MNHRLAAIHPQIKRKKAGQRLCLTDDDRLSNLFALRTLSSISSATQALIFRRTAQANE
jgi:hypothetical protein